MTGKGNPIPFNCPEFQARPRIDLDWEGVLDKWGIGLGLLIVLGGYLRTIIKWIKGLVTQDIRDLGDQLACTRGEVQKLRTDIARLDTYLRAKVDGDLNLERLQEKQSGIGD